MARRDARLTLGPPPPPAVLRAMNAVMRPLRSSRLGRRVPDVMLLELRGRRTGRTLRVPVSFHLVDGTPMAFADARWRLNSEGGAPVTVTHRGRVHRTRADLVPVTPQGMAGAVRKSLVTGGSAQRMGVKVRPGHERSVADLANLGAALGTSVIKFDVGR